MSGEFIVTQVGLNNTTSAAQPGGLLVKLPTFKLGAGTGYTPTKSDTALHGAVVYTGVITGFIRQGDGSLLIACVVPPDAGPFTFGEIGIYTDAGDLFALACLPTPVTKVGGLSSGFGATYTFNGLLKLGASATTIDLEALGPTTFPVQYISTWAALEPAPLVGPQLYFTIISQVDNKGDYSVAVRNATTGKWSIQTNYRAVRPTAVINTVAGDKSYLTISLASWLVLCPGDTSLAKAIATSFVVQAPNGYMCMATASAAGSFVQFTFSEPFIKGDLAAGQPLKMYTNYSL